MIENLLFYLFVAVALGIFVGMFVFFILSAFHFFRSIEGIKGKRADVLANVFAPFSILMPWLYSSEGNWHRRRFLLFTCLFLICLVMLLGFKFWAKHLTVGE